MAHLIPDSLHNQPGATRGIVRVSKALANGLDADAYAWFEPPFDPSGEKPHFVILMPDNGIAVLEVLDVQQNKLLGLVRGKLRVELDGKEVELAHPLERAEAFAETLREALKDEPALEDLDIAVRSAAVFPSLTQETIADLPDLVLDPARTFLQEDVDAGLGGDSESSFRAKMVRLLGASVPLDDTMVDVIRGTLHPEIRLGRHFQPRLPGTGSSVSDTVAVMDRRQEALAKRLGSGHRIVRGVAGSGKTVILLARAKIFAGLWPEQRFLITCYTRSLAGSLRKAVERFDNIEVETLDSLIWRAIRDAGLEWPGFKDDENARIGLKALEAGALPRYRAVFVDEAQDFGTDALAFARSLADPRFNDLLIVEDAAQNVFSKRASWKSAGIQAQGRTVILRKNYRNTREILKLAFSLLAAGGDRDADPEDEAMIIPPQMAMRSGKHPTVRFCNEESALEHAVSVARRYSTKADPGSLGLLALSTAQARAMSGALAEAGITAFFATDPRQKQNRDLIGETDEAVVISTVFSAKGLEFPSVVLLCEPTTWQDDDQLRKAVYVGMTRATDELTVVMDPAHPLATELRQVLEADAQSPVELPEPV